MGRSAARTILHPIGLPIWLCLIESSRNKAHCAIVLTPSESISSEPVIAQVWQCVKIAHCPGVAMCQDRVKDWHRCPVKISLFSYRKFSWNWHVRSHICIDNTWRD